MTKSRVWISLLALMFVATVVVGTVVIVKQQDRIDDLTQWSYDATAQLNENSAMTKTLRDEVVKFRLELNDVEQELNTLKSNGSSSRG